MTTLLLLRRVLPWVLAPALALACSATSDSPDEGDAAAAGTTSSGGGGAPEGAMLTIAPAEAVLHVEDGGPAATLVYQAVLVGPGDTTEDVTDEATFAVLDESLGSFAGATFTAAGEPGKTKVRASARGLEAETDLTIKASKIVIAPGAPQDAPGKFGGPVDAAKAPELVYPADGVIVPPNMKVLELHFLPGAGNDLFELTFETELLDVIVYLVCSPVGAGCGYVPDETVWKLVTDAGRGTPPIPYRLRGVTSADPSSVGESAPRSIGFSKEDLTGGIYYWNAGAGATIRVDFGIANQVPQTYMTAATAGATTCVGCHVLSRNGERIAIGLDVPAPSPYKVFEVSTKSQYYAQGSQFGGGANFFSFSPDATKILTSNGISTVLRDATTGAALVDPVVAIGTMPDWSPDGGSMVYAKPGLVPPCIGSFCGAPSVDSASLEVMTWDGSTFGNPKVLVPFGGQNNYYPSYSPDGAWVIFNRSPSNINSFDASDAQVWAVPAEGGSPMHLATASTGGDSWPKWAPNIQTYAGGTVFWFTFSSRRAYGLRLAQGTTAQIWMAAFDPAKGKSGQDPSLPAFWLPFQDMASGNHIAQWVTSVKYQPCFRPSDCPSGEECLDGQCIPVPK